MSEDWIQNLAGDQKRAEAELEEHVLAATTEQRQFDAAVAPFWSAVQDELQRCVSDYNEAIGREDLTISTEPSRRRSSRHQGSPADRGSFVIYRGEGNSAYCKVNLNSASREVVVSYSASDGSEEDDSTPAKSMTFEVANEGAAAQAVIGDGTPTAVARAILSEWASHFPSTPPESREDSR